MCPKPVQQEDTDNSSNHLLSTALQATTDSKGRKNFLFKGLGKHCLLELGCGSALASAACAACEVLALVPDWCEDSWQVTRSSNKSLLKPSDTFAGAVPQQS